MPWYLKPTAMNSTQLISASMSGIARRDVAGNWMNGMIDQMLMKKIQKKRVAMNGNHLTASLPSRLPPVMLFLVRS